MNGCRVAGSDLSADGAQPGDRRRRTGWGCRGYLSRRSGAGRPGACARERRGGAVSRHIANGCDLHFDKRPPDPKPDRSLFVVAAFRHVVSTFGRDDFSILTLFADQQMCGSPYGAVGDRSCSLLPRFISHRSSNNRRGLLCFSRYPRPSAKWSSSRQSPTRRCACCRSEVHIY